jgi:DNA topoisomerase-1
MSKNLVIVESPAKAKTIEKYLGSDFKVLSSIGHIRSIAKKAVDGKKPIDTNHGYETVYEIDPEKKKVITELKKAVKAADAVWLATDEDREGEAIAWHLCEVLKLNPKTTKRIVFHEITKNAIEEAIKKPRTVDMDLVRAQQARQILDRLVGFELSPVVWRKVPGGKSAGRVQSPAVRLMVEREREIESFESSFSFKVIAEFTHNGESIKAELSNRFCTEEEAREFLESLIGSKFTVANITTSPSTRNPSAPFTTSTLQQEANSRLGFGAKATMSSAQKLYQDGKITYMRTDSVNLSGQAIAAAADYIKAKFGESYSQIRKFQTKSASAQEAHEAIRPTDISLEKASGNEYDQKLYDLIRRRTLACQMAPAKLEKTVITIDIGLPDGTKSEMVFEAKGEVILFDGFLKVYGGKSSDGEILPSVTVKDNLLLNFANARQLFARPPARYTEGSLVKKLEDLGIGRPSTYATIINTVQIRGYVEKGENEGSPRDVIVLNLENNSVKREIITEKTGSNRGKLTPTAAGEVLSDFLVNHFDQIVDYGFTATVETSFDKIATGALARNAMLDDFYIPFHKLIEESGGIDRSSVAKAREIGVDPKTGKVILARFGRYGPMLQIGSSDDPDNKPQFAPMPAGSKIETVTLEEALYAFKLPRIVGQTPDGTEIKANIGRFGPYVQIGKLFVSIKPFDPHTITLDESIELYNAKLKSEAEKNIADFGDGIKVLKGRFGPYITDGTKNVKIPKDTLPTAITLEQAKELLNAAPNNKKRRVLQRKNSKKV